MRFSQHSSLLKQILFIVQCLIEVHRGPQGVEYDLFVLLLSLISYAGNGDESGDIRDQVRPKGTREEEDRDGLQGGWSHLCGNLRL